MSMRLDRRTAVVVDEYPLWIESVEQVLGRLGVDVVGKATRPDEALEVIEEHRPDLLITEIRMPNGEYDGIELVRRARELLPELRAVVLSMYDDAARIAAAFAAGVEGYVLKTADPEDLISAIRQTFDHSLYFGGAHLSMVPPPRPPDERPRLTPRELQILRLVAKGYSNSDLARTLGVTKQTIKFHIANVYRKLEVSNRAEATSSARLRGLLSGAPPTGATG